MAHWIHELLPRILPNNIILYQIGHDGAQYLRYFSVSAHTVRHSIIFSGEDKSDGKRWLHLSIATYPPGTGNIPSYHLLCEMKDLFIGPNRDAYMVFPRKSEHVNIHPECLHLWAPVGHKPLPDFAGTLADGRKTI